MKTYKEIVDDVKAKNPGLKAQDVQKAASVIFRAAKKAADELKAATPPPVVPATAPVIPNTPQALKENIDRDLSGAVDAAIRKAGVNRHSIISIAHNFHPDFHMVLDGKQGVNTKCHLEGPCRVPESGYFIIYLQ